MVTKPNGTVVNVDLGLRVVLFLMVTKLMVPGAAGKHGLRVVLFSAISKRADGVERAGGERLSGGEKWK